jgi:hypothetical protein
MSTNEPGLDLQEWETRWAEIEEALAEDPATELPLACDEIQRLLAVRDGDKALGTQFSELEVSYEAARDVANRLEAGLDVDPGDVDAAIEDLRAIRDAILPAGGPE